LSHPSFEATKLPARNTVVMIEKVRTGEDMV
jgi:hypothetical protein